MTVIAAIPVAARGGSRSSFSPPFLRRLACSGQLSQSMLSFGPGTAPSNLACQPPREPIALLHSAALFLPWSTIRAPSMIRVRGRVRRQHFPIRHRWVRSSGRLAGFTGKPDRPQVPHRLYRQFRVRALSLLRQPVVLPAVRGANLGREKEDPGLFMRDRRENRSEKRSRPESCLSLTQSWTEKHRGSRPCQSSE